MLAGERAYKGLTHLVIIILYLSKHVVSFRAQNGLLINYKRYEKHFIKYQIYYNKGNQFYFCDNGYCDTARIYNKSRNSGNALLFSNCFTTLAASCQLCHDGDYIGKLPVIVVHLS